MSRVLSRRMASHRNFALFVVVAIVVVAGHQWMSIRIPTTSSDASHLPSSSTTHRAWSWSWKDSSLRHLWQGDDDTQDEPPTTTPDHSLVDDAEEEDPEAEVDGHYHTTGQHPSSSSALVYGPEPFSYLPPTNLLPLTNLIQHAPGWTTFENIYLSNGTLFVVTTDPSKWPQTRMMISVAMEAVNSPENIKAREPTPYQLSFVSPAEADRLWGDRIWEIKDWTVSGFRRPPRI